MAKFYKLNKIKYIDVPRDSEDDVEVVSEYTCANLISMFSEWYRKKFNRKCIIHEVNESDGELVAIYSYKVDKNNNMMYDIRLEVSK